jgi:hypothetical protein
VTEARIADRLSAAVRDGQLPSGYSVERGAGRAVNAMLALAARAHLASSRGELLTHAAAAISTVLGTK